MLMVWSLDFVATLAGHRIHRRCLLLIAIFLDRVFVYLQCARDRRSSMLSLYCYYARPWIVEYRAPASPTKLAKSPCFNSMEKNSLFITSLDF